jgi:phosphoribosylanthranilate isomerase
MVPMFRTRVKICGVTRSEDGVMAAELGADAIGLVFYPPSPRFVGRATAQRIVAALPPFVVTVGLFMNAEPAAVQTVLESVRLDLLQFHGDETPVYCEFFGKPYLKAVPMGANAGRAGLRTTVSPARPVCCWTAMAARKWAGPVRVLTGRGFPLNDINR